MPNERREAALRAMREISGAGHPILNKRIPIDSATFKLSNGNPIVGISAVKGIQYVSCIWAQLSSGGINEDKLFEFT